MINDKLQVNLPFKLSETAYNELVEVLQDEIGQEAINGLGEDNIHHIGHHLLTLIAIQVILIHYKCQTLGIIYNCV